MIIKRGGACRMGTDDFQPGACRGPQCPNHRLCRHHGAGCQRRRGQTHALGQNTGGTDVACGMRNIALRTKIGPIATRHQIGDGLRFGLRGAMPETHQNKRHRQHRRQNHTPDQARVAGGRGGVVLRLHAARFTTFHAKVQSLFRRSGPANEKGGTIGTAPVHGKGPDQNPALINSNVSAIRSRSSLLVGNCARIGTSISSRPEATRSSSVTSAFNAAALAEP
jgi:hypothetical protein